MNRVEEPQEAVKENEHDEQEPGLLREAKKVERGKTKVKNVGFLPSNRNRTALVARSTGMREDSHAQRLLRKNVGALL